MRTTALLFLISTLMIIADLSFTCAERIRVSQRKHSESQILVAVEDWEYGSYFGAGLGFCTALWLVGACISSHRQVSRLVIPTVRGSVIGAAMLGGLFGIVFGIVLLATGQAGTEERYEWESRWLIGSLVGAVGGGAIGAGLGAVSLTRQPKRMS